RRPSLRDHPARHRAGGGRRCRRAPHAAPGARAAPPPPPPPPARAPRARPLPRGGVLPAGSTLVLVGDLDPRAATDAVAAALAPWASTGHAVEAPPVSELQFPDIELVDRPGAVQSNIRLGGLAPGRTAPDLAAARLASMIFGGHLSSP